MALSFQIKNSLQNKANLKTLMPLLQANIQDLNTKISQINESNPFIEVHENKNFSNTLLSSSFEDMELIDDEDSLFDVVIAQLTAPLFPTPQSVNIAHDILNDINEDGYFDGSFEEIALKNSVDIQQVEKIQQRFMYLEPKGVGARDLTECLLFQLYDLDVKKEVYDALYSIITNPKKLPKSLKQESFDEISSIFKSFIHPPSINFAKKDVEIIPDFIVKEEDGNLVLNYNDLYTPEVNVNNFFKANNEELKNKLKEARLFVELLSLRKNTLHKIVLEVLKVQKEFFLNGELKPLLLKDLSKIFSFSDSTISRAVANKYIQCSRGIIPLRSFFSYKVTGDCSLSQVKNLIKRLVQSEEKTSCLSDEKLKDLVNETLSLNLSRRAITKYRLSLNIPSSRQRKNLSFFS